MADIISASLAGKTPTERSLIKAEALASVVLDKFELRGYAVTIKELTTEGNKLKVVVNATKDGKEIYPDNPLYFINPPWIIPDGIYHTAKFKDRRTGLITEKQIEGMKEDPKAALQEIIVQTLEVTT
jgi:hypothetical protein